MKTLQELLDRLWEDYATLNQQAYQIHRLLEKRGEEVVNDHIAFRTFNIPKVGIDILAQPFVRFGYQPKGEYHFPAKKLFAKHYEHSDPNNPKIFISELKIEEFSQDLQKTVNDMVAKVLAKATKDPQFLVSGRLWKNVSYDTYCKLKDESEYAAWMAVYGFRVNHFTVFFNTLKSFKSFVEFNQFLKDNGFKLNDSGGEIKGSPKEYLEQSSTLAYPVEIEFSDKKSTIPSCYYEFAKRYPLPNGKLFHGFVAQSADKIFESTDNKLKKPRN